MTKAACLGAAGKPLQQATPGLAVKHLKGPPSPETRE
jgi:hypothetical protein